MLLHMQLIVGELEAAKMQIFHQVERGGKPLSLEKNFFIPLVALLT
jgi:hypothetical protein